MFLDILQLVWGYSVLYFPVLAMHKVMDNTWIPLEILFIVGGPFVWDYVPIWMWVTFVIVTHTSITWVDV